MSESSTTEPQPVTILLGQVLAALIGTAGVLLYLMIADDPFRLRMPVPEPTVTDQITKTVRTVQFGIQCAPMSKDSRGCPGPVGPSK